MKYPLQTAAYSYRPAIHQACTAVMALTNMDAFYKAFNVNPAMQCAKRLIKE
ncbi:MAG: hypothetical protein R2765_07235 [Ferruginibacter sp.]